MGTSYYQKALIKTQRNSLPMSAVMVDRTLAPSAESVAPITMVCSPESPTIEIQNGNSPPEKIARVTCKCTSTHFCNPNQITHIRQ